MFKTVKSTVVGETGAHLTLEELRKICEEQVKLVRAEWLKRQKARATYTIKTLLLGQEGNFGLMGRFRYPIIRGCISWMYYNSFFGIEQLKKLRIIRCNFAQTMQMAKGSLGFCTIEWLSRPISLKNSTLLLKF